MVSWDDVHIVLVHVPPLLSGVHEGKVFFLSSCLLESAADHQVAAAMPIMM